MSTSQGRSRWSVTTLLLALAATLALSACGKRRAAPTTLTWICGAVQPEFDPDGPPDANRWALERLLTRGLFERDSTGRAVPDAVERAEVSADSLTYVLRLKPGLRYSDQSAVTSGDFRRALEAGLARTDHSTRSWLLAAVVGVDQIRPGRPLPPLGIETPDSSTLVLRLAMPDRDLLHKLAVPGATSAWKRRDGVSWRKAIGSGRYRVITQDSTRRLVLMRMPEESSGADTLIVRFGLGAPRVRSLLRQNAADFVWPVPPGLLDEPLPAGFQSTTRPALPPRRLYLVMRADLPPTSRLATRHALAHALNRDDLERAIGPYGRPLRAWLHGAEPYAFPRLDQDEVLAWMERGRLGRSFHVDMAYDSDGPAAAAARSLQGEWSRLSIYVELVPLRGKKLEIEMLKGRTHLLLVDAQPLLDDPASEVASLVMPLRGPAVGPFRTGWRTREFDPWILPGGTEGPFPSAQAQRRLEEEMVVLPLAQLPWLWIERTDRSSRGFHPSFGPNPAAVENPSIPR